MGNLGFAARGRCCGPPRGSGENPTWLVGVRLFAQCSLLAVRHEGDHALTRHGQKIGLSFVLRPPRHPSLHLISSLADKGSRSGGENAIHVDACTTRRASAHSDYFFGVGTRLLQKMKGNTRNVVALAVGPAREQSTVGALGGASFHRRVVLDGTRAEMHAIVQQIKGLPVSLCPFGTARFFFEGTLPSAEK